MHSLSALRLTMNTLSFSRIYSLFCDFTMDSPSVSRIYLESTFFLRITLNSLSASRLHYEFTICFANSPRIHFFLLNHYKFAMKSLWNHYETTMESLWIHHLLRDFTRNSSSFSRIHYLYREFSMNSLFASWFLFEFTISIANSLSVSRIHLESTVLLLWMHYLFRLFTIYSPLPLIVIF